MNNKIILITGASRGIGRFTAEFLHNKGFTVIANYNNSFDSAQELKNKGIDIIKADVSKRSEVKNMVDYCINKYGKIDVLINNAGISSYKLFTDLTDEDWNNVISTNLYSAFCVSQEVLPNMIHNKSGCVINISSIWGLMGASCESIYAISKAGIDAMTKSLAKELGPSNIRVNSIAPGIIQTDMNKNLSTKDLNEIKNDIPMQKIGLSEDIAKCIYWLIDDNYTNGQIISIDGGWSIT